MGYNIEDVATPRAFKKNPQLVLDFYNMRRRDVAEAMPNKAHHTLAELEKEYNVTIITQNIDDLHERAGSTNVIHLHGEIFKMRSSNDHTIIQSIKTDIQLGDVAPDGAQWRPHIVWFEEPVPLIEDAALIMGIADIFLLIGTSLQVYPAAGLIHYLPEETPKFIIDKKIPPTGALKNVKIIEASATVGIEEFVRELK
jgi:NAD-dependent deacetylase